ncbi:MAG: hypothetical protein QW786_03160 [Candidatus Hadarchaeum sp.]
MSIGMAGATFGSGVLNYLGQREANRTNRDIAREATQANLQEAELNRKFQERMSNTARQREVKDLEKAGLNPLLAAMSSASSPAGSTGSSVQATVENELSGALSSALEAKQLGLAIERQKEDLELIRAQKGKTKMETKVLSKGIPEAEIKNEVFQKFIRPGLNKLEQSIESGARFMKNPSEAINESLKKLSIPKGGLR